MSNSIVNYKDKGTYYTPIPLTRIPLNKIIKEKEEESLNIYEVSLVAYRIFIKRPSIEVFIIYLYKVEE